MKLLHTLAATALILAPMPALAADGQPIPLARTSKWEINYDVDSCHLLARFGAGQQEVILKLTRFQPGDPFDLTLYGEPVKGPRTTLPLQIRFGSAFPAGKREGMTGTSGSKMPLVIVSGARFDAWGYPGGAQPAPITPEQETAIAAVDLSVRGKDYRLETGSLGKPMEAMRTCLTSLIAHWSFDPAVQQRLSQPAKPIDNPGNWLRTGDYPLASALLGNNGLVQFRLDVSETGGVAGCRVLYRTNPDDFADRTCTLLSNRARLTPARDAAGLPVKSYYVGKVRWMMPEN
jgi:Gram-negative bacterial TonB protein C-terminal